MNREIFERTLSDQYRTLFASDPDYAYSAAHTTPDALAAKMTAGLLTGAANKEGKGIKSACKALGVKYTYGAIRAYLEG